MRVCLLIPRLGEETWSLFFGTSFKTSSPIPGDPVLRVADVQGGWAAGKFRGGRRALVTRSWINMERTPSVYSPVPSSLVGGAQSPELLIH